MKLSATNQAAAEALEAEFAKTLFQNAEQFVQTYNSGMVNKRNSAIAELAAKVEDTYRNIELVGGELTTISTDAISLNEIGEAYARWSVIVATRNAIRDFAATNTQVEGFILSDENKKGYLLAVTKVEIDSDEMEELSDYEAEALASYEFVPLAKVAKNAEAATEALGSYAQARTFEGFNEPVLEVRPDIQQVDTAFLETVAEELAQH